MSRKGDPIVSISVRLISVVSIMFLAVACSTKETAESNSDTLLIALGEQLFTDPELSQDGQISCSTCHVPASMFIDAKPASEGVHGILGTRNAPSLADINLMSSFFWDGREAKLEDVSILAFTNPAEMAVPDNQALVEKIKQNDKHIARFERIFDSRDINIDHVKTAMTAYLRSIPVPPTRYDRYLQSGDHSLMSEDELAGIAIFKGKADCVECHPLQGDPVHFTDNLYHHTGIGFEKVSGNVNEMMERIQDAESKGLALGTLILSDPDVAQLGRFVATRDPQDLGAFRTPSLRNIANTAPYMHDGSVLTLEEAVEYEIYYRGLSRGRPINITAEEKRQLTAFLRALDSPPSSPPL
ncbi:MAG: methylamine utilization protein [Xanthomonadaceae bacterium]|jgi:cytochrome c peroxidase|nr:methylamine utilization protein [Xanthomonadaceae bacterium]